MEILQRLESFRKTTVKARNVPERLTERQQHDVEHIATALEAASSLGCALVRHRQLP